MVGKQPSIEMGCDKIGRLVGIAHSCYPLCFTPQKYRLSIAHFRGFYVKNRTPIRPFILCATPLTSPSRDYLFSPPTCGEGGGEVRIFLRNPLDFLEQIFYNEPWKRTCLS